MVKYVLPFIIKQEEVQNIIAVQKNVDLARYLHTRSKS